VDDDYWAPGRPWQSLNFLPEPQGQGAFREVVAYGSSDFWVAVFLAAPSSPGAE
jgi:hypothetical protein